MYREGRRIKLERGKQREIIYKIAKKYGSLKNLAIKKGIPYSTLKKYAQEIFLLPESLFNKILKISDTKKENLNIIYLSNNWGNSLGGKRGMAALQKKYPKEIIEWRKKARKNSSAHNLKTITEPELNEQLSEFIGAYLGDGTINKYQIRISGDRRYDYIYYKYLSKLVIQLFGITPSIRKERNTKTNQLVIYSKNVCEFLNKNFGIKYGDKIRNKTVIPKEIMGDKKLVVACLRGLMDTDGSISRRGRNGSQFCIQFTSHNVELLKQVNEIGRNLKIFTFSDKTGAGTNKWSNIIRYFQIIGSSNPKHIVRFHLKYYNNKTIYRKELNKYFKQDLYKSINLPFKIEGLVV